MGVRLSRKVTVNWTNRPERPPLADDPHPMTMQEFRQICTDLQLADSVTAASAFGLSWRTCQRYWLGEQKVPGPLARLLRLAQFIEYDLRQGVPPP